MLRTCRHQAWGTRYRMGQVRLPGAMEGAGAPRSLLGGPRPLCWAASARPLSPKPGWLPGPLQEGVGVLGPPRAPAAPRSESPTPLTATEGAGQGGETEAGPGALSCTGPQRPADPLTTGQLSSLPFLGPVGPWGQVQAAVWRGEQWLSPPPPRPTWEEAGMHDLGILRFHEYCIRRTARSPGPQLTAGPPAEPSGDAPQAPGGGTTALASGDGRAPPAALGAHPESQAGSRRLLDTQPRRPGVWV